MTDITIYNYEAFLLDSAEGTLSGEQQLALDVFLIEHPELGIDLEGLSETTFNPPQSVYENKESLKKTASDLVSADQFIAYVEQHLSMEEKTALEKSCALNPSLAAELNLYQSTIAIADTNIVFENKESLKRKARVIWFNLTATQFAAAASVTLLVLLYVLWPTKAGQEAIHPYANAVIEKRIHPEPAHISPLTHSTSIAQNPVMPPQKGSGFRNSLAVNNIMPLHTTHPSTVAISNPDTLSKMAVIKEPVIAPGKDPALIASIDHKTIVEVITENDDEAALQTSKKQGFWSLAGKTLKGLNKAGVKSVDGKEDNYKDDASYDLTLGPLSITHTSH